MNKIRFNENRNVIHAKLKEARENLGMTQGELATKLQTFGISIDQQAISRIEKNLRIVRDYELAYLCKILKVDEKFMLRNLEK